MSIRERQKLPDTILNAPELFVGLEFFYTAFLDLTSCRAVMEGPISWLAIDEYAARRLVEVEQREDLLYHIPKMDKVFLDHNSKKHKKDTAVKGPKKSSRK